MPRQWLRCWDIVFAGVIAIFAALWLPTAALSNITEELIAFFGIQSAIILPAMIFTAGILRPEGLNLTEIDRYHKALKTQMVFWVVLLCLDFAAVISLIIGEAIDWVASVEIRSNDIDLAPIIVFLFSAVGTLAILRTIPFIGGVLSLLELNGEMARKAIERRLKSEKAQRANPSDNSFTLPSGYGKVLPPED